MSEERSIYELSDYIAERLTDGSLKITDKQSQTSRILTKKSATMLWDCIVFVHQQVEFTDQLKNTL